MVQMQRPEHCWTLHTAVESYISEIGSWPAQVLMENPAGPSRQLPDVHVVKPKLEPGDDSPLPRADAAEDQETTPLSGDHPFFTAVMSRTQVQKPYQLVIPGHFHRHLPAGRAAAVLRCRGRSWIMGYCSDTKVKRLDAAWADFAIDNRLLVGDACVFELVAGGDGGGGGGSSAGREVVFQVQILRGGLPEEVASKGATADEPIVIVD